MKYYRAGNTAKCLVLSDKFQDEWCNPDTENQPCLKPCPHWRL